MRIIAITNQKGGVAKTTSVLNIAAGLRENNKKVLVIDADPQANLTASFGLSEENIDGSIYDILHNPSKIKSLIKSNNGIDIIPSTLALAGAEQEFGGLGGNEKLKEALKHLRGYDFILIDSPPSLGVLVLNCLVAAHEVIIPVQPGFFSLSGIKDLLSTIEKVKHYTSNKTLKITGFIITLYDSRKLVHKETITLLNENFPEKVFKTHIRNNVSLTESPAHGKDIFLYQKKSNGAEDYLNLTNEIIKRG